MDTVPPLQIKAWDDRSLLYIQKTSQCTIHRHVVKENRCLKRLMDPIPHQDDLFQTLRGHSDIVFVDDTWMAVLQSIRVEQARQELDLATVKTKTPYFLKTLSCADAKGTRHVRCRVLTQKVQDNRWARRDPDGISATHLADGPIPRRHCTAASV